MSSYDIATFQHLEQAVSSLRTVDMRALGVALI